MANIGSLLRSGKPWGPASELQSLQQEPKFLPLEVRSLKYLLLNGLNRGCIAELNGPRSSGKTSTSLHVLAQSTTQGEVCAVVDLNSSFHPHSAVAAGVKLDRLVWVQCQGNVEYALRSVDLLLHAGGFGVVLLDLCEAPARVLNRIPLSFWYRFRQVVEHTPTILLVCADTFQSKSCSKQALNIKAKSFHWTGHSPGKLLQGLAATATFNKVRSEKITSIRPESLMLTVA